MANEELDIFEEAAGGVFRPPEQPKTPENIFQYIGQTPAFQTAKEKTGEFFKKEVVVTENPVAKKVAGALGHAYDFLSWDDKDRSGQYIQAYEDDLKTGKKSFRGLGMPFALLAKLGRETTQFVFPEQVASTFTKIEMEKPITMGESAFALAAIGLDLIPAAFTVKQALKPGLEKAVKHVLLEQGLKETPENISKATKLLSNEALDDVQLIIHRVNEYDSVGAARVGDPALRFEDEIIKTPGQKKYQRAKAKVDPEKREPWNALSVEDKQKHLLEQFELISSGQKTKEAVSNELGYVSHNWKTIEKAADLKYEDWIKTYQPTDDILSQKFKVKSTNQKDKEIIKAQTPERIDPGTGHVMTTPSRHKKKQILDVLENTKASQPDNYKWSDEDFSLAFSNEYKKIFPGAFKGTGGSNKFMSDRELAQKMLAFQGSKIKLENLPVTLRYDESGIQKDITRGGIQSNKAAWEQTAIGDRTTGLGLKHARTQLLDLDGTWNSVKSSIYRDPIISDFLEPIKKNVAGGFDIDHIIPPRFGGTNNRNNLRFIIKGSHKGETLSPDMASVNAAVKNKSAMEDEVFKLNEKMINLVVKGEKAEAKAIRQDIQTIVNNFQKTNPNTDFGVGMPHVVVKTGDNTAANVRLIDYLQLDDTTKKLIETDFIVYKQNLPSAGKSLEKTAEEVGQMYLPLIDAAGGKLPPDIAKQLFEGKDGGSVSIEEVIDSESMKKGGAVKRALGSPEEGELGSGIAGDDPYFDIKTLDLDLSPFEGAEDLDIFEEARKGGAQEYQTANLLLPFMKLFGKAPKHEIVPIPTPKKDLTKQSRLQKQSLDKEKEKIIAADELEVFDPSPDVRLEGAVLPEGVPSVATAPITGEPLTSVFYADIEKILARPDAPKQFKGHWRTNKQTGEKEWATPKDEIWDYFNLHHIRKSEAADYRIPQLLKMFDDEAVITADQIINQVRNAPITGVKVHGTGHKSGFMNMSGKDIVAKFADQHMEPGHIPGTYGERVLVIPRSKLPGDTGKYPTSFQGENISYHRFGEGDDEYVIGWTRNSDRMAIVPSKVEGPKVKTDTRAINKELKQVQSEMNGLLSTAGRRIGFDDAIGEVGGATLDDILANASRFSPEDLPLLKQINELDVKQQKLMSMLQDAKLPDTSGVVKVRFADEIQSDLLQVAAARKQRLAATLRKLKEENQVANDLSSYNDINSQLMKFYEKNESVFRPLQVTGEELNVFKTKIDEMDAKVNEVVDNYVATREISDEDLMNLSKMLNDNLDNMLDEILVVDSSTMEKLIPDVPFKNRKEWADALLKINLYEMAYDKFVLKNPTAADWFVPSPGHFISNRYGFKGDTSTPLAERYADKQRQIQAFNNDGSFLESKLKGVGVAEFYGGPNATAPTTWRIIDKNQPIERNVNGRIEKDFKAVEKGFTNIEDATKAYDELGGRTEGSTIFVEEVPGKHYTGDLETILKKQAKDNNSVMEVLQVQTKAGGADVFRITDQNGNMVATLSDKEQAKELIRQNPNYNIESIRVPSANTTSPAFGIKITEEMLELYPTHKAQGGLVEDIDIFEVA